MGAGEQLSLVVPPTVISSIEPLCHLLPRHFTVSSMMIMVTYTGIFFKQYFNLKRHLSAVRLPASTFEKQDVECE